MTVIEPPPSFYTCSIHKFAPSIELADVADALQEYLHWDGATRDLALKFLRDGEMIVITKGAHDLVQTRVATLGPKLAKRFGKQAEANSDGRVCVFSIDKV